MKKTILLLSLFACFSINTQAQCPTTIDEVSGGTFYVFHITSLAQCALYYPTTPVNTVIQIGGQNFGVQDCYDNGTSGSPDVIVELQGLTAVTLASLPNPFTLTIGGVNCSFINPPGATSVVLPIQLLSFEGKALEKSNLLTWRTASETQNKGFDIERSTDGSRFEKIGFVAGSGTTSQTQRYTFEDNITKSPLWGFRGLYYRLKQLDEDGRFEYSKIVAITQKGDNAVSVFPNPSKGIFTLSGLKNIEDEQISIVNSIGQNIAITVQNDGQMDLSAYPSGVYYLRIASSGQVMKLIHQ
jgi:hypothetical protein